MSGSAEGQRKGFKRDVETLRVTSMFTFLIIVMDLQVHLYVKLIKLLINKYVNDISVKRRMEGEKKGKEERKGRKEAGKRSRDGEWLSHADCRALGDGLYKLQMRRPQDNQTAKLPWILREPQVSPNKNQQSDDLLFFLRFLSLSLLSYVYLQFSQISKNNFHTI